MRHGRRWAFAWATALLTLLALAPSALAWNGNLEVRKVNLGGPSTDVFNFKVESGAYGQPLFSLVPSGDYTGAPWKDKSKPDNPFALVGAPAAAGPFTAIGPDPTTALFTGLDSGGQAAAAPPAVRDWRRFRVSETYKPAGYKTAVGCGIRNAASGAPWDASLDSAWGTWSATPTGEGGGDGVETTLRFLPDTVAQADQGPWTVTCTFTNTYRARVKVIKDFDDPLSTTSSVGITVNGAGVTTSTGDAAFVDGAASDFVAVDGGSNVALAEQGTATTSLSDFTSTLECRVGSAGTYGDWAVVPGGTAGTLAAVAPGKDYECRFTNVRKAGTTPPPGSGTQPVGPIPGTTPPPAGPVTSSATPVAGSARVEGNAGCVTGAYAIADVRGRGIVRVVFRVNGRVVKTLTNANVAGMYRLRVPASSLPRGANRATADVRFRAVSKLAPRRLSFVFNRCPRRVGRPPTFTG